MMNILAHRGLSAKYPENTLIAFEAAAKLPIWGVEAAHVVDGRVERISASI